MRWVSLSMISLSIPVPPLARQPRFHSDIYSQIGGRECALRVRDLSLQIQDSAHSLKLIRCPTQAKGWSSVLTNICLLPPSMRLDSRYIQRVTVGAICLSVSDQVSYPYPPSHSSPSLPFLGWHYNKVYYKTEAVPMLGHLRTDINMRFVIAMIEG